MARVAKSFQVLRLQLNALFPKRSKVSDGGIGDPAHARRKSDHNPNRAGVVTARDFTHDPENGIDCHRLAELLIKLRDPRIKYIIWNRRISSDRTTGSWKKYTGANAHTQHLHLSVSSLPAHYDDRTAWNLDGLLKPAAKTNSVKNLTSTEPAEASTTSPSAETGASANLSTDNETAAPAPDLPQGESSAASDSSSQSGVQRAENITNVNTSENSAAIEQPDAPFAQYLPDITKEKLLFGGGIAATAIANLIAWWQNLSLPAQIVLAVLFLLVVAGFIWLLVTHRREISQLIREAMQLKADKTKNSPVLTTEKPDAPSQIPGAVNFL